ncbi:hypothetical protein FM106_17005 [Brachybacterium faecium]|nr:hypothetical protein FM106_17005 [Brachybacterium faecium]
MSAEKDDGAEKSEEATELLGTGTWIRQGPATLVLRENAWVVLVPGLRKQVTEAAWTVLGDKPAPEDFLDRLVEAGQLGSADKLTAILFGFHDGADAVFGVKGTTPIAVYTADGSQQIAGTEEEPFVLTTLHGVRRVAFGDLPAEESIGAPRLSAGIVPVRGFVHVTMDPAALADADRAALAEHIEADGRSIEDPEAKKRRAARPAPAPKPASSSAAPSKLTPALATRKSGEMPPSLSRGGARSSASSRGAAAAPEPTGPNRFADLFGDSAPAAKSTEGRSTAPPVSELENTGAYDDLFGKTVFRRIEDAAVRRTEEDAEEQGEPEHASTSTTDHPGQEAPAPRAATGTVPSAETVAEPEPEESSAPSEFIDWVPGVGRTAPEIAQTAARRGSAPRPAESAYPQVHMAERPPAPNTGSRPAPVRPATPNGQAGPLPQHGAPMMSGAAGQHVGYSAQAPSAPPQPHRPMDPGAAGAQVGYPGPHGAHPPHSGGPPHGAPPQAGPPARPLSPHHGQHPAPSTAGPGTPGALALPGLVCGNGHANSPERAVCRVCHAPLQGPTRTVARPPLGTIWTSYGERVVLDRTAILGRRPRASRVSAQDVPQLITVPSPQQDISRSHLELRLEGWHVVAIDLGTTNGTTLHRAGFDPARLRAREGVVLRDGDALDLGDGVHLRYGEKA